VVGGPDQLPVCTSRAVDLQATEYPDERLEPAVVLAVLALCRPPGRTKLGCTGVAFGG